MSPAPPPDPGTAAVLAYHEATKHHPGGYAPAPGFLDWDAQPDPFRRWHPAPLCELPLIDGAGPGTFEGLHRRDIEPVPLDARSLSLWLELALGLSAWKRLGPDRWALRNNPSSGNLHPTEGYLLLWRPVSETIPPGLYHYAPREHALERRARLPGADARALAAAVPGSFGALAFSSIPWREEWKYGARAYRYCQLDVGHALGAARYAAAALGWSLRVDAGPGDRRLAGLIGLDRQADLAGAEPEHPELLARVGDGDLVAPDWTALAAAWSDWRGQASRISGERVRWPEIARVLGAAARPDRTGGAERQAPVSPVSPPPADPSPDAVTLIRSRRSAQRMDPATGIGGEAFRRLLARTLPAPGQIPFDAFPYAAAIHLAIFAHAVEGLPPGLYLLLRDGGRGRSLLAALGGGDAPRVDGDLPLYHLQAPADLRRTASGLCCHQGIAGRGAFAVALLADLGHRLPADGAWAWRRLHWEAGLVGQVLYLEAEAAGLRGTGIGCFFDDEVHRLLGLPTGPDAPWQVAYHFTVGRPVDDGRLTSEPPYAHLSAQGRPTVSLR